MTATDRNESSNSSISGKLVIISILLIAFVGAGISWYFRYSATHRAARFWSAGSAVLIRDASQVTLRLTPIAGEAQSPVDISQARGLVHLRNALLEDHNFVWPEVTSSGPLDGTWILEFRNPEDKTVAIQFTQDCGFAERVVSSKEAGSIRSTFVRTDATMAKGLREMFGEFMSAGSVNDGGAKPQAAGEADGATR